MLRGGDSMTDQEKINACLDLGASIAEIEHLQGEGFSIDDIYSAVLNTSMRYEAKSAAEFGDDKTEFVWTPYIPIGDYTVLMADGGTGKTIFCCGIAATISRGEWLPSNEAAETPSPSNTLIISAEDRGELLKKRLIASGADLQRVYILDCMDSEGMNFTDGYDDFMATIKRYKY